jgi:hypothetical protein
LNYVSKVPREQTLRLFKGFHTIKKENVECSIIGTKKDCQHNSNTKDVSNGMSVRDLMFFTLLPTPTRMPPYLNLLDKYLWPIHLYRYIDRSIGMCLPIVL